MVGTFACPQCFSEIVPKGVTPGRRVRCFGCGTMVEVPFLVRAGASKRGRRRWKSTWIWIGLAVAAILLLIAAGTRLIKTRASRAVEEEVALHLGSSKTAEGSGQFDRALTEVETALAIRRRNHDPETHELLVLRDRLSVRDAETRLAAALSLRSSDDPGELDRLIQSLQELKDRSRKEDVLTPFADNIDETLARLRTQRAEFALAMAEKELDAGRPESAVRFCERAMNDGDALRSEYSAPIREKANAEASRIVSRFGVVIEPVRGEFLQGPSAGLVHTSSLQPGVSEALRRHHFVPRPEDSPFARIWDESAPFRLVIQISERNDGVYFQTPLRTSALTAQMTLSQSGKTLWSGRASGKTRVPPPNMSAFEASHMAMVRIRDPAIEKRLYDDARTALAEGISAAMRNLPSP